MTKTAGSLSGIRKCLATVASAIVLSGSAGALFAQSADDGLSRDTLLSLGFVFDDRPRPMCTIDGPHGPCNVEAFASHESDTDTTAYTCSKLDRATYLGRCRDGLLDGVSVIFADGSSKSSRQAFVSYFLRGRMAYPALISFLDSDNSNFGIREKGMAYGCVYFGKWDQKSTRNSCPKFMDIFGNDIFTESNAKDLENGSFDLDRYSARFLIYAQGKRGGHPGSSPALD